MITAEEQNVPQSQIEAGPGHIVWPQVVKMHEDAVSNFTSFTKLSNYECFYQYQSIFKWRPHLLLVSENIDYAIEINSSVLRWDIITPAVSRSNGVYNGAVWSFTWTRNEGNLHEANASREYIETWASIGDRIQYCLLRGNTPGADDAQQCHIQGSPLLLLGMAEIFLFQRLS